MTTSREATERYRAAKRKAASDLSWQADAVCRVERVPTELFFDEARAMEAIEVCVRCPVQRECALAASHRREPMGVWGGRRRGAGTRRGEEAA